MSVTNLKQINNETVFLMGRQSTVVMQASEVPAPRNWLKSQETTSNSLGTSCPLTLSPLTMGLKMHMCIPQASTHTCMSEKLNNNMTDTLNG